MLVTDFFLLKDFDDVLKKFPSRKNSQRYILLKILRSYYEKDEDLNKKGTIPSDEIIQKIWGKKGTITDEKELKKYRKAFSALKSGVNRLLKDMHKKGTNPKGVRVMRTNRFGIIESAKEDIIEQLSIKISALKMYLSKVETKIKRDEGGLSPDEKADAEGDLYKDKGIEETVQEMEDIIRKARSEEGDEASLENFKEQTSTLEESKDAEDVLARTKQEGAEKDAVKPKDVKAAYLDTKGEDVPDRDMFLDVSVEEEDVSVDQKEKKKEKEAEQDVTVPEVTKEEIKSDGERQKIEDIQKELEELRKMKEELNRREKKLEEELDRIEKREKQIRDREEELKKKEEELKKLRDQLEKEKDEKRIQELEEKLQRLEEEKRKLQKERDELAKQSESLKEQLEELKKRLDDIKKQEKDGEALYKKKGGKEKEITTQEDVKVESSELGLAGISAEEEVNFLKKAIGDDFDELKRSYAKLVKIHGGSCEIGSENKSRNEGPRHRIEINDFLVGKYPIVNELFQQFIEKTGYKTDAERMGYGWVLTQTKWQERPESYRKGSFYFQRGGYKKVKGACWRHPFGLDSGIEDKMTHPVVQVSYRDAQAFCSWVEAELPTEFQWEYMAKAGDSQKIYSWGNIFEEGRCNSIESGFLDTTPVDKYEGNPWHVFDSCGNTWEWCANWYMPDYRAVEDNARDPSGPVFGVYRTLR
ncbi:MAG: SUMF1/EgtB/PvdO family nonheme iron enzyme, partial [Candidatus Aureabacteria bacterium]|nr:SUMF1/EgtB/PvdO family nonheme iron enzyme [Candidatus Auribacterota bacterium]